MVRTLLVLISIIPACAQSPVIVGIGDSLGEGVQSDNASVVSQPHGYLNDIATQAGATFPLPLIQSNLFGEAGSAKGRSRVSLTTMPQDLAVSGATVSDVLTQVAHRIPIAETDLVLAPYYGMSQIQIVEQLKPDVVFCWVGNDDLINYVLDYDSLNNPSGITPFGQFASDYQSLMSRLKATGAKVVVANIPDLTKVGYLFNNDDLTKYLGTDYHLPPGTVTTFEAMLLVKLGSLTPDVFTNPAYLLTSQQLTHIRNQVVLYNQVIAQAAAAQGFPVVDAFTIVDSLIVHPLKLEGITIGTHYNQGAFSLDGIHPSDTGYAVFANAFINTGNQAYGLGIPPLSLADEIAIFNRDPFIDFNGNGIVPGRPDTGLLETLGPAAGISGDMHEHGGGSTINASAPIDAATFMRAYLQAMGRNPNTPWQSADVKAAVHEMLHSWRQ